MTGPWLSVVMPTYNGEAMLADALASIAREDDGGVEVIAIDDGSTDGTLDILGTFSDRLSMTVVRRRVGNWAMNTNHGLELATAPWACILHQDDVWRRSLAGRPRTTHGDPGRVVIASRLSVH